jgi:hypothetical protein
MIRFNLSLFVLNTDNASHNNYKMIMTDAFGDIGPFRLAIALTVVTMVLILGWKENYGHNEAEGDVHTISSSIKASLQVICSSPTMLCLGLSQSCFEGAIYTFGE